MCLSIIPCYHTYSTIHYEGSNIDYYHHMLLPTPNTLTLPSTTSTTKLIYHNKLASIDHMLSAVSIIPKLCISLQVVIRKTTERQQL
jgi:hypothetical protein